jgi:transposase
MGKKNGKGTQHRNYTPEFRLGAVRRMEAGECVSALSRKLGVRRKLLYEWRTRYRERGAAGLQRGSGRERLTAEQRQQRVGEDDARQIAELERKVGRQALLIDFFQRASKRVEELRRKNGEPGATASTGRSGV